MNDAAGAAATLINDNDNNGSPKLTDKMEIDAGYEAATDLDKAIENLKLNVETKIYPLNKNLPPIVRQKILESGAKV